MSLFYPPEVFQILGNIHARSSFIEIIEGLYDKGAEVNNIVSISMKIMLSVLWSDRKLFNT